MNVLIIEDETLAYKKLEKMLKKLIPDINIIGVSKSIEQSIKIINSNKIDLGFFDIQIQDGLSLDIFEQTKVDFPVIFTTAFNEYAIKAFKINSIDYLLKPITEDELNAAINKYKKHWKSKGSAIDANIINEVKSLLSGNYKERFTVYIGNRIKIINTNDICYFYSQDKATYAVTIGNSSNLLDNSLENIFQLLNPDRFFKISRKYIVNIQYINDIYAYSNSRLKVNTKINNKHELIVSREKVKKFKKWLENN